MPQSKQKLQVQRFSLRLQEALQKRNLSAPQFAESLGVNASTVHRWLRDGITPHPRTIGDVAALLEVDREWLTGRDVHVDHLAPVAEISSRIQEVEPGARRLDHGAPDGQCAAFEYLMENEPLPYLIERLTEILADETQSSEKIVKISRAMIPAIRRRSAQLALQMQYPK